MKALLAVLLLSTLAVAQTYWVDPVNWPIYGGALEIRHTPTYTASVPAAFDRAALWWWALFRTDGTGSFNAFISDISDGLIGDVATSTAAQNVGYNTLRMVRAHAWNRMNDCPTVMPLNAGYLSSHVNDCNAAGTNVSAPSVRYSRWIKQTVSDFESSINRYDIQESDGSKVHREIMGPKMAVVDLLCRSATGYNTGTHRFDTCSDYGHAVEVQSSTEMACGGFSTRWPDPESAWLRAYSVNCILIAQSENISARIEYDIRSTTAMLPGARGWGIQAAAHTVNFNGNLMFTMFGQFLRAAPGGTTTGTLFLGDGTVKRSFNNEMTDSVKNYMYWDTGMPVTSFAWNASCMAYRWRLCSGSPRVCIWYPGGNTQPHGWLKTYGLGGCKQNYCQCLQQEPVPLSPATSDVVVNTTHLCCEEDCYIRAFGYQCTVSDPSTCFMNSTCDGVRPMCDPPAYKSEGTLCGPAGQSDLNECNPHMRCNATGFCKNNTKNDGDPCGNTTVTECSGADFCQSGVCMPNNFANNATKCGTTTTEPTCRERDWCWNGLCQVGAGIKNINAFCQEGDSPQCSFKRCTVTGVCQEFARPSTTTCSHSLTNNSFRNTPSDTECWDTNFCTGRLDLPGLPVPNCPAVWRPNTWTCKPKIVDKICSADWKCTGTSTQCIPKYAANNSGSNSSVVCRPGDSCDPTEYCQYNSDDCPADMPCLTCRAFTNSVDCITKPVPLPAMNFYGCKWCGMIGGGCQNRTAEADISCNVPVCGDSSTMDPVKAESLSTGATCLNTNEPATSLEAVTPVTLTAGNVKSLRSFCFVVELTSNTNATWFLGTSNSGPLFQYSVPVYPVFYDDSASQPGSLIHAIANPVWINYFNGSALLTGDRGLYLVNYEIPKFISTANPVWLLFGRKFIGIKYTNTCPGMDVVALQPVTANPLIEMSNSYSRGTPGSGSWDVEIGIPMLFSPVADCGWCGDGQIEYTVDGLVCNEECDNQSQLAFCNNCQCDEDHFGIPNPANKGCICSYPLPIPDAHNFTTPPEIVDGSLHYNSANHTVSLWVKLHNTNPGRSAVAAKLVNSRNGSDTTMTGAWVDDVSLPVYRTSPHFYMKPYPCYWLGWKEWEIDYLIANGQPMAVLKDEFHYAIEFAIEVSWCEPVVMYRKDRPASVNQERCMNARLTFDIIVSRDLTAKSNVTLIDSNVLWAYIHRGFLNIPASGNPWFDVELETAPKSSGLKIEETTFYPLADKYTGAVVSISSPITFVSQSGSTIVYQQWAYKVYLNIDSICTLGDADTYALSFNLISSGSSVSPSRQNITFKLNTMEDWCADEIEMELQGRQRTFPNEISVYNKDLSSVPEYLRGSKIYVVVDVPSKHNLPLTGVDITSVTVYGEAAVDFYDPEWVIYWLDCSVDPCIENIDIDWDVHPFECDIPLNPQGCYSMNLPNIHLLENKPLTIETVVELTFSAKRREADNVAFPETAHSLSRVYLRSATTTEAPVDEAVVVYRVTPAFVAAVGTLAFISVLSIVSTVVFIRRRESSRL